MTGAPAGTALGAAQSMTAPAEPNRGAISPPGARATAASAAQPRAGGGARYKYPRHFTNMVSEDINIHTQNSTHKKRRRPTNPALAGALDDSWFDNRMSHGEAIKRALQVERKAQTTKRFRRATSTPVHVDVAETSDTPGPDTSWPRSRDRSAPKPPKLTKAWVAAIQRESQSWDPARRYGRASIRFVKEIDRWQKRLKKYFKHECVQRASTMCRTAHPFTSSVALVQRDVLRKQHPRCSQPHPRAHRLPACGTCQQDHERGGGRV